MAPIRPRRVAKPPAKRDETLWQVRDERDEALAREAGHDSAHQDLLRELEQLREVTRRAEPNGN